MRIKTCNLCGANEDFLNSVLNLGRQPLSEDLNSNLTYPLNLMKCSTCGMYQLDWRVPRDLLFKPDHPYSTGNSQELVQHYKKLAESITTKEHDLIVDIGCNDGTLLNNFNCRTIGIDPTDQVDKFGGFKFKSFFGRVLAEEVVEKYGHSNYIFSNNVLAHVASPHGFMDGINTLLDDEGVFITENHDINSILEGGQWDTIYHEHLRYWSIETLGRLFKMHNIHMVDYEKIPTHGGSFRVYAKKDNSNDFQLHVADVAQELITMFRQIAWINGKIIWGVGATTRAATLLNFCGARPGWIKCILEMPNSDKVNYELPGTGIPIVSEDVLFTGEIQPDYLLILSWHLKDIIIKKYRDRGYRGQFIIPLPRPYVI